MGEPTKIGVGIRIMAFLCRICPLCVPARRWPTSGYARRIRVIQNHCPCCAARVRVQRVQQAASSAARAAAVTGA